jgi:Trypsin-like peptidase domain
MRICWLLTVWALASLHTSAAAEPDRGVVILVVEFEDGKKDVGTGFFVDHDGLVVTADHVVNRYSSTPAAPPFNPGPSRRAKKITAYSAYLRKKFLLDLSTSPNAATTGQFAQGKWLDVAFLRFPIDEDSRRLIEPLDLASDPPNQNARVFPWGPKCTTLTDESCFVPISNTASITNSPRKAKEYVLGAILKVGFSGGPLVDESGRVVGVCSFGTELPLRPDTYNESYVPAGFILRFYLNSLPPSPFFGASSVCDRLRPFPSLTSFDLQQIAVPWAQNPSSFSDPAVCTCCCESLGKSPNGLLPSALSGAAACAPPWCPETSFYASFRALRSELQLLGGSEVALTSLYREVSVAYYAVLSRGTVSNANLAAIHRVYGDSMTALASEPTMVKFESELYGRALSAYDRSVKLAPNKEVYASMGQILQNQGDLRGALAAQVLAQYAGVQAADPKIADKTFKDLKINIKDLQKVLRNAPAIATRQ